MDHRIHEYACLFAGKVCLAPLVTYIPYIREVLVGMSDALLKIQIALENDTEVYLSKVEQLEGSLDQTAKHYSQLFAATEEAEHRAEEHALAKQELETLLAGIDKIEGAVDKLSKIAEELDRWTTSLVDNARK